MSNLVDDDEIEEYTKEFVVTTFESLILLKNQYDELLRVENIKDLKEYKQLYILLEKALTLYSKTLKPNYDEIIESFKRKYIKTESLVEKNDTKEQIQGVRDVYDYIQKYDINNINFFVASLQINLKLWKPTDNKNNQDIVALKEKLTLEIQTLLEEAKKDKDINKINEAQKKQKELQSLNYKSKIGGVLRTNDYLDDVKFQNIDYKVPKALEACKFINNLSSTDKINEFKKYYESDDLMAYIFYVIKLTTDLIKYQPFMDGNKRTFRSLLNLLFKARNLPPVYIKKEEIEEYKKALFKGVLEEKYDDLNFFYMNKLCDSIYELDIIPYLKYKEAKEQKNKKLN